MSSCKAAERHYINQTYDQFLIIIVHEGKLNNQMPSSKSDHWSIYINNVYLSWEMYGGIFLATI